MSNSTLTSKTNARTRPIEAIPVYARITQDLYRRISTGEWGAGVMLPSRKALAAEYSVDVNTLQRAIAPLLGDGALRADGGRGTFVSADAEDGGASATVSLPIGGRKVLCVGIIWKTDRESETVYAPNVWAPVVFGIERAVSLSGGMSRVIDTGHPSMSSLSLVEAVNELVAQGVDGIVSVVDRDVAEIEEFLSDPASSLVPLVHAGGTLRRGYRLSVYFSNIDAGFHAASHLLRQGCPDLLLFSAYHAEWVSQRLEGVREAADAFGMGRDAVRTHIADIDLYPLLERPRVDKIQLDLAYKAAKAVLKDGLPARGIVAANDYNAHSFIKAACEAGYTAGRDYAIIGFDDFPESSLMGLTTMRPPLDAMGREAAAMLVRAIAQPGQAMHTCLPADLVARASTMTYSAEAAKAFDVQTSAKSTPRSYIG